MFVSVNRIKLKNLQLLLERKNVLFGIGYNENLIF